MNWSAASEPSLASLLARYIPHILSPLAGALVTLSFAPFGWWPLGLLSLMALIVLLENCSTGQAALRGWLYGLGMFGSGVSWVYVSINVHGGASVALATVLTVLFCAGLALLTAAFAALWARFVRPLPGGALLGFPVLWVLFEWLRSWLLTGFPWLYLGYAHIDTALGQWAPVLGVFGVSLATALSASALLVLLRLRSAAAPTVAAIVLGTCWGGGMWLAPKTWVEEGQKLSVAVVQPNVPQQQKWDRRYYPLILDQFRTATQTAVKTADLVLWPESAIPNYYQRAEGFITEMNLLADRYRSALVTGIPWIDAEQRVVYNSIVAGGEGSGVYHKQRLVPFGEYVPLEAVLRGLIDFFNLPMSNFSSGPPGQPPLQVRELSAAPYICYEIVYPDLVAASAADSDFIITISNDSWFGASIGPLQHLQMARMRALENERYVVRGTNNGVSAIIDHRGRLAYSSEQFVSTTLVGHAYAQSGRTPFSERGSWPVLLGCLITPFLLPLLKYLPRRRRR